jgi:cellulase
MLSKSILLTTAIMATASAHQNLHSVFINDASPGPYIGIRMPPSNSPVTDLTSNDMACNVPSTNGQAVKTLDAAAGDSIKVQWDQSGHPGPITHFVLPVKDAATATGVGAGWIKIDELDYVGGKWASEIMGAANMTHEFKLPTGLASGEYLVRTPYHRSSSQNQTKTSY